MEIFPNPSSENATISFSLNEESPVVINLFDINGKMIAEIENNMYTEGTHQVSFNSAHMSTGIYLFRLTTNEGASSKKLVIEH